MSHNTEDGLGRRRFQVQKEKAVEEAYEKIRRSFGEDWNSFSAEDQRSLREVLREVWTDVEHESWKDYGFSTLSYDEVGSLITIAKEVQSQKCLTRDALARLDEILE
ncbi:MAG: hypothetical protein WCF90_09125 [Methanomicrobiales archaeon]